MQYPNLANMLPKLAEASLVAYFLQKLIASKLNIYADPTYSLQQAISEAPTAYASSITVKCYEAALATYNRLHPKGWDKEKQTPFRVGLCIP